MAEADKPDEPEDDEAFLATMRERYKLCVDAERENRARAKEALLFRDLEQWDEKIKNERLNDSEGARPCIVVDKLNQHVQQVVGDQRQNRPQIKVKPGDNAARPEVAKIFDGMMRQMQYKSHADVSYDTAFEAAVDGGFGYWRLHTDFADALSFDQEIKILRIRNRFSVYLDPERKQPDGSDAKYGFIFYKVQRKAFKAEFGAEGSDALDAFGSEGREFIDWYGDDWVLYAEYFHKKTEKVTIALLEEGKDGVPLAEVPAGMVPLDTRETELCKIVWSKVTATKVLDGWSTTNQDKGALVWDRIPVVEVIGNELDIEGMVRRSGMIRPAMDAQRVDNYSTSAFIEQVALAPRASWTATPGQMEGNEELWRTANRRNISVLPWKPVSVDGVIVPRPERVQPPGISQGWLSVMEQSQFNVMASMGRYQASLGQASNETSGKAIANRAREADVGSFHFSDNLTRSLTFTGQMCVDAWPKLITKKRTVWVIGEDGEQQSAILDPNLKGADGKDCAYAEVPNAEGGMDKVYNLSCGKYTVVVSAGASYTTRRLESADAMMEISRGNPEFLDKFGDIIFKAQDWPGADQIAARFKKMLPPELAEAEEVQDREGKLARREAQVSSAVQQLGAQEAQLNQVQEQVAAEAQEAEQKTQAAKDAEEKAKEATRRAQAEVDKLNAAQATLAAERELFTMQKKLAEKEIEVERTTLQSEKDVIEAEIKVIQERMDSKLAELNHANADAERATKESEGTAKIVTEFADKIKEVLDAVGADRELVYDEHGEPTGSRPVRRAA